MVARAAGFQNLQHLQSANAVLRRLNERPVLPPADARNVELPQPNACS